MHASRRLRRYLGLAVDSPAADDGVLYVADATPSSAHVGEVGLGFEPDKDLGVGSVAGVARKLPVWKKRIKKAGHKVDKLKVSKCCSKQKVATAKMGASSLWSAHIWARLSYGATAWASAQTQLRAVRALAATATGVEGHCMCPNHGHTVGVG